VKKGGGGEVSTFSNGGERVGSLEVICLHMESTGDVGCATVSFLLSLRKNIGMSKGGEEREGKGE